MSNKKILIVSIPYCDAFFDQDGNYIGSIHENDGEYREEYFNKLFRHFYIGVKRINLSKELEHKIDVSLHSNGELSDFFLDIKKDIQKHG